MRICNAEEGHTQTWVTLCDTLGTAIPANPLILQDESVTLGMVMFSDQVPPNNAGPVLRNTVAQATWTHCWHARSAMIFNKLLTPPGLVTVTFQHPSQYILDSWFLKTRCQTAAVSLRACIFALWCSSRKEKSLCECKLLQMVGPCGLPLCEKPC